MFAAHPYNPPLLAMVNVRTLLLALLPVVSDRPTTIFLAPDIIQMAVSHGSSSPPDSSDTIMDMVLPIQVAAADERRRKERARSRASPAIGGQRITEEWLRSLEESDCIWRFRYEAGVQSMPGQY
jgi:hypothetical protein